MPKALAYISPIKGEKVIIGKVSRSSKCVTCETNVDDTLVLMSFPFELGYEVRPKVVFF